MTYYDEDRDPTNLEEIEEDFETLQEVVEYLKKNPESKDLIWWVSPELVQVPLVDPSGVRFYRLVSASALEKYIDLDLPYEDELEDL